jgi:PHD/YefM family antitoxin component YafN of YafNO toxin-antitoxin module
MGTVHTKNRILDTINTMPLEKLDAVLAFLEDFQRSSEDETAMLMSDPNFVRDYREAKEDIRTGNTVRLKAIRRDV